MVVQYAGPAAIATGIVMGYWRFRTERSKRNLIQRFPLLLPAVVFLVTSSLVLTYGPVPIGEYKGVNSKTMSSSSHYNFTFTMLEPGIAYEDEVSFVVSAYLSDSESLHVVSVF